MNINTIVKLSAVVMAVCAVFNVILNFIKFFNMD